MTKILLHSTKNGKESSREALFRNLVADTDGYRLVENKESIPSFIIYFDTTLANMDKEEVVDELLEYKDHYVSKAILDITEGTIAELGLNEFSILCIACAGFVTCSSAEVQEKIYMDTGRLAHIVSDPLSPSDFTVADSDEDKNTDEPKIVWYGSPKEIFTVRKEQVDALDYKIHTVLLRQGVRSDRKLAASINSADIIYLPQPFDDEGEIARLNKVEESILKGKFIVAPNLPVGLEDLAFQGNLKEAVEFFKTTDITTWIEEKQTILKQERGVEKSAQQLCQAFETAPEDDFLLNLELALENEEF